MIERKNGVVMNGLRTARALSPPVRNRTQRRVALSFEQVIWPREKVNVSARAAFPVTVTGEQILVDSGAGLVIHDILLRGVSGRPQEGEPLKLEVNQGDEVTFVVENTGDDAVPKIFKARIEEGDHR